MAWGRPPGISSRQGTAWKRKSKRSACSPTRSSDRSRNPRHRIGGTRMRTAPTLALALTLVLMPLVADAQLMIIGNDDKFAFVKTCKTIRRPPGKDSISIVDISSPEAPKIVANLPLMNSIVGPPTNLAITPDHKLAIVANSVDWQKDGDDWKQVPDNKLYVIDLTTSPPAHLATVDVGKQPSGLSINKAGNLALIANRADNSISVLSISGKEVKLIDTVPMGEQVDQV